MKGPFSSLHARALCHATESLESVKLAVQNAVGEADLQVTRTSGHHGNEILVIEAHFRGTEHGIRLFDRLSGSDKGMVLDTLDKRVDESCNLFLRVDKQKAFQGDIAITSCGDAIAVRMKVTAFPAKKEIALQILGEFLTASE